MPIAVPAQASIDPYEQVRLDANALAASMQALHGGVWSTNVDHATRLAVIIGRD